MPVSKCPLLKSYLEWEIKKILIDKKVILIWLFLLNFLLLLLKVYLIYIIWIILITNKIEK